MSGPVNGDASVSAQMSTMVFLNNSGQTVPAFGCMKITNTQAAPSGQTILVITQPDGGVHNLAFNGPTQVANNAYGNCYITRPCPALYDGSLSFPANGDVWGPKAGSWKLFRHFPGFRVFGQANLTLTIAPVIDDIQQLVEGVLYTDLAEATFGGATAATAQLYIYSGSGALWNNANPGEVITVSNRDTTFYAPAGTYLICVRINNEWRPIPTMAPTDEYIWGTLTGPLASGGSSGIAVQKWNGSAWVSSGLNVTVYEHMGLSSSLPTGTKVGAIWHAQAARYLAIVKPGC